MKLERKKPLPIEGIQFDGLFLIGQIANKLDITYSDCLTWLSGTHDFTVSEIIKIEEFLGEKLINIE